ncbi:MAG: phosphoribosyltransferase [Candidatus Hodarchaeota archaeon]
MEYLHLTYDDMDSMTFDVFQQIQESGFRPDIILGIARGGWLPARIMSDCYDSIGMDDVEVISVTTKYYAGIGKRSRRVMLQQEYGRSLVGLKVLLVDDVSDTGNTLRFVLKYVHWLGAEEAKIATVMYKTGALRPDYYAREVDRDVWIVFPYEKREFGRLQAVEKGT